MAVMRITFLLAIHIWILLFGVELIMPEYLIILLYMSNIMLILTAFWREWFPPKDNFKEEVSGEIAHDIKQTAYALSPRDSVYRWPNLYIKRWKSKYLDQPIEYPLDRIAFLTAKYNQSEEEGCIKLKNSQMKQLVKKLGLASYEQILDELHPCKMVSECYDTYLHRRCSFYAKRNVVIGGGKQLTRPGKKMKFREIDGQEVVVFQASSPFSSVVDLSTGGHPSYNYLPTIEEEGDDKVKSRWRRFRRAFSR